MPPAHRAIADRDHVVETTASDHDQLPQVSVALVSGEPAAPTDWRDKPER